jgi:hypothetical protein
MIDAQSARIVHSLGSKEEMGNPPDHMLQERSSPPKTSRMPAMMMKMLLHPQPG